MACHTQKKETRGNAITQHLSHPIPKFYIFEWEFFGVLDLVIEENAYCETAVGSALTTVAGYSYLTNTTLTCIMDLHSLETSL